MNKGKCYILTLMIGTLLTTGPRQPLPGTARTSNTIITDDKTSKAKLFILHGFRTLKAA